MIGATPTKGESSTHLAVLNWIPELRAVLRETEPFAQLLDFDGLDAIDLLLSPIYLNSAETLRRGPAKPTTTTRRLTTRLRNWAFQHKTAVLRKLATRHSAPVAPADVLLWTRDVTHTEMLLPVAEALRVQGVSSRVVACQPNVFEEIRVLVPDAVYTLAAWPNELQAARVDAAQRVRQLAAIERWPIPPIDHPHSDHLPGTIREIVLALLPQLAETLVNARMILERFQPKVLVVGNDLTMEGRAGCRIAAAHQVPTATFMHGSIAGSALQSRHCVDRIVVFGNIHRRELIEQGTNPDRIVVCGAPNLDRLRHQSGAIHPWLKSHLGLRDGDPWILVATSGPGHRISHKHHDRLIGNLTQLATSLPNVPIVIKLHRKDRLEYYQAGLRDCAATKLCVVPRDAYGFPHDIFDWLHGCSMVLTGASTVAIEAMLMGVPVVTMDFAQEIHDIDFIDAGTTVHVTTTEELEQATRHLLELGSQAGKNGFGESLARFPEELRPRVQAILEETYYALDGRSAMRSAAVLQELGARGGAH